MSRNEALQLSTTAACQAQHKADTDIARPPWN
jgi:hypothetical protein